MDQDKLTENVIIDCVADYLANKTNGNWHREKTQKVKGHKHGPDLTLIGGKRNSERFIIECKGKSYAKSADSINKEGWLNALGQLITRMDAERIIQSGTHKGDVSRAYKYGMGLCWIGAQVALRRIPRSIAKTLNLYIFSVYDDGWVRQWSPKDVGKHYVEVDFQEPQS